jgi:hypothetical protein
LGIENSNFLEINQESLPVVVITGACRSGKTLLGNLLATCPQAEYADEPHTGMLLPMLASTGKIETEFAAGWLAANFSELFNELLLLRGANFRSTDLSSIWTKKPQNEIFYRLKRLNTRADAVQYARKNGSSLVVTLSECVPFLEFIRKALPGSRFVHVVRNGYDVARDVAAKRWLSDEQLMHPMNAQLYTPIHRDRLTWYLPWWVNDEEHEYFLRLTEYERGIYYWCLLVEKGLDALRSSDYGEIRVRYEDLVANPQQEFNRVAGSLGFQPGLLTKLRIDEIRPIIEGLPHPAIDPSLEKRLQKLNMKLGDAKYEK